MQDISEAKFYNIMSENNVLPPLVRERYKLLKETLEIINKDNFLNNYIL